MCSVTGWTRRVAVTVLATFAVGVATVLSAGPATAGVCEQPSGIGNVTVAAGVATVGVSLANVGTPTHDVVVCAEAPGVLADTTVDVTPQSPTGTSVVVHSCVGVVVVLPGCWESAPTVGATAGPPSTAGVPSADPPQDGNGWTGVRTGTGSTACVSASVFAPPVSMCSGDVGYPADGYVYPLLFVDYMLYEAQYGVPNYPSWCVEVLFQGYTAEEMAWWCSIIVTNRAVTGPLNALL